MQSPGDILKPTVVNICHHIDQKTFTDAIVSLGLLSESDLLQRNNDDDDDKDKDEDDDKDDNDDDESITVMSEASSITSSSSSSSSSSLSLSSSRSSTKVCLSIVAIVIACNSIHKGYVSVLAVQL